MGASGRQDAGIVFTDCEFTAAVSAGASASAGGGSGAHGLRMPTSAGRSSIAGKRIKTVDVHAHCIVPDAAKIINHPLEAPALLWSDVGTRLAHMDKIRRRCRGAEINPFWYRAERDAAAN